jgi:hypothetical protein
LGYYVGDRVETEIREDGTFLRAHFPSGDEPLDGGVTGTWQETGDHIVLTARYRLTIHSTLPSWTVLLKKGPGCSYLLDLSRGGGALG